MTSARHRGREENGGGGEGARPPLPSDWESGGRRSANRRAAPPASPRPLSAALAVPRLEERPRFPAHAAAARGVLGTVVPGGRWPRTWSGRSRWRRARA